MDELQRLTELWAMTDTSAYLNIFGLTLDIIGVIVLFKFGLPADIRRGGEEPLLMEGIDQEQIDKAARYDRMSFVGLSVLIFGFLVQGAGSVALLASS